MSFLLETHSHFCILILELISKSHNYVSWKFVLKSPSQIYRQQPEVQRRRDAIPRFFSYLLEWYNVQPIPFIMNFDIKSLFVKWWILYKIHKYQLKHFDKYKKCNYHKFMSSYVQKMSRSRTRQWLIDTLESFFTLLFPNKSTVLD